MSFMQIPKQFNLIPVKNKTPLIPWKEFTERKQTAEERNAFISSRQQLGIVTGKVSGILVLDDDGGLDVKKYPVPRTWCATTPRGGKHYFFRWVYALDSKITTETGILEKVDVRGNGGCVVFYGFEKPCHASPLAEPPQWLIDLLPNKDEKSSVLANLEEIKEGNRNDSFTRLAGSFRARGYSSDEIFGFLRAEADKHNFPHSELRTICDSVGRYKPRFEVVGNPSSSIEEFLKETEAVEWIVPGLIAKKSIGFVAGLPETGKTWMLIDLALECAKGGGSWLNRFPVKSGKVLFIDQERFKGETQRRFRAVMAGKEVNSSVLKDALFVRCGTSTRLDLQNSYEAFHKEISEIRPDIIIVDSFATFHNSEENNRKDIQVVLERIKSLRTEFGCTFLFIHHENKYAFNKDGDQEPSISQMAGSIAIPAACETVLTVRKQDAESSMVYHTKSTLSSTIEPFLVKVTDLNDEKTAIKVEAF